MLPTAPERLMSGFVLFLVLVPLIGPVLAGAVQALMSGGNPLGPLLRMPGYILSLWYRVPGAGHLLASLVGSATAAKVANSRFVRIPPIFSTRRM